MNSSVMLLSDVCEILILEEKTEKYLVKCIKYLPGQSVTYMWDRQMWRTFKSFFYSLKPATNKKKN